MDTSLRGTHFEDLRHPISVPEKSQAPHVSLTDSGGEIQVSSAGKRGDERSSIQRCASGMVVKPPIEVVRILGGKEEKIEVLHFRMIYR